MSSFSKQIGGGHYKKYAIQPIQYAFENQLDHGQGTVVDYVTRFRDKGGRQDLEKAIHILEMMIEWEYGRDDKETEPNSEGPRYIEIPTTSSQFTLPFQRL